MNWRSGGAVEAADLAAMARDGDTALVRVGPGPAGMFSTLGAETVEVTASTLIVADLGVTNLGDLQARVGRAAEGRVLTALYEQDGPAFVRHLRGGFALALWDQRRQTLLLAVDHFGIKRLLYRIDGQHGAFASRADAVVRAPGMPQAVDLNAVYSYLAFGYVPAPGSAFAGVRRLAPGHLLLIQDGREAAQRYWNLAYDERDLDERAAAATLHDLAEQAVKRALGEATPKTLGAFLSGGTDSSTIVGLASRLTGEPVNAFSIGFREDHYNELPYAEIAARHFGATHYVKTVAAGEALDVLPQIVEAHEEPFGNSSGLGTYFAAQFARDCGVTCLLAGDGGDEIFGGNERYRSDRVLARYQRLPAALRRGLVEPVVLGLPDGGRSLLGRAQRYIGRANVPNPRRLYLSEFFFLRQAATVLTPEFRASVDPEAPYATLETHYHQAPAASELNRILHLDMKLTIGDNDLLKVTRTAELASVDVRFPFLDLPLVEFTGALPASFKVRRLEKRYLFKRAFAALLPPETLAKRKHGFGVPTSQWLRQHPAFRDFGREVLLGARARQRGYFQPGALERLFDLHDAERSPYYGDLLWTVLMLELWQCHHVDGRPAA